MVEKVIKEIGEGFRVERKVKEREIMIKEEDKWIIEGEVEKVEGRRGRVIGWRRRRGIERNGMDIGSEWMDE